MKRILLILILLSLGSLAVGAGVVLNSFHSGVLSPRMEARSDIRNYYTGCRELENMILETQGGVEKRPGTHYIDIGVGGGDWSYETREYPTLQELTDDEIPDPNAEPSVTTATTAVNNATELEAMTGAGKYYLTTDVNLVGVDWTPITDFNGVFDGNGFTISNLTIDAADTDYQAMFGTILAGAEIYDVNIDGFDITGKDYASCLVGHMTGGSCILKDIEFTDCNLTGKEYVGTLAGYIKDSDGDNIYSCSITGGAIVGSIAEGRVRAVGGVIGWIVAKYTPDEQSNITNCFIDSTSVVTWTGGSSDSSLGIGGFVGFLLGSESNPADKYLTVHTCYSEAEMSFATDKSSFIGNFAGEVDFVVKIVSCYATGGITTSSAGTTITKVGGFVGDESTYAEYIDSYSTGAITLSGTAVSSVGGFMGNCDYTTRTHILRCWTTSQITIPSTCETVGGFIGYCQGKQHDVGPEGDGALIERCWSEGDMIFSSSGSVKYIGGLIGRHEDGINSFDRQPMEIKNCYSWSSITIDDTNNISYDCGFIGILIATSDYELTITNCYDAQTDTAAGSGFTYQIPEGTRSGGLIGYEVDDDVGIVTACYWDTETSGLETSLYGVGHTTDWLQTKSNFEDVSWNFDTIWVLTETGDKGFTPITDSEDYPVRIISFEHSVEEAYIVELGDTYMRFYKEAD